MPNDQNITRKLKAILSADVKGYSLLMSDDEAFTIRTLKEYRRIMSTHIEQNNGRVVDAPGDGCQSMGVCGCPAQVQQILIGFIVSLCIELRGQDGDFRQVQIKSIGTCSQEFRVDPLGSVD